MIYIVQVSWVKPPSRFWKTPLCTRLPVPLVLTVFLSLIPQCSLSLGDRSCDVDETSQLGKADHSELYSTFWTAVVFCHGLQHGEEKLCWRGESWTYLWVYLEWARDYIAVVKCKAEGSPLVDKGFWANFITLDLSLFVPLWTAVAYEQNVLSGCIQVIPLYLRYWVQIMINTLCFN